MKYSNEEKLSIITRYQQGESAIALSNELAIPRSTLYRWFNSFPTDSSGKPLKFSYQKYALLQRKVEKLQNIITILQSVDCLVSAPLKERLHALEPFYGKYEVHTICEALDVDRGTFYNHMLRSKRGNAWFDKRRQEYCQLIRDVFDEYRQVLGAEKIRTIRPDPLQIHRLLQPVLCTLPRSDQKCISGKSIRERRTCIRMRRCFRVGRKPRPRFVFQSRYCLCYSQPFQQPPKL